MQEEVVHSFSHPFIPSLPHAGLTCICPLSMPTWLPGASGNCAWQPGSCLPCLSPKGTVPAGSCAQSSLCLAAAFPRGRNDPYQLNTLPPGQNRPQSNIGTVEVWSGMGQSHLVSAHLSLPLPNPLLHGRHGGVTSERAHQLLPQPALTRVSMGVPEHMSAFASVMMCVGAARMRTVSQQLEQLLAHDRCSVSVEG